MSEKGVEKQVQRMFGKYMDLDKPMFSSNKHLEALYFKFWSIFYKVKSFPYQVKYFIQKVFRGYDDLDKWNAAWYIARKAVPVLKEMRNNFHGTSVRYHIENRHGEIVELTHSEVFHGDEIPESLSEEQWRSILDDIIFAFQWQIDFDSFDGTVSEDDFKEGNKRQKRGLKLFSIYFNSLWD